MPAYGFDANKNLIGVYSTNETPNINEFEIDTDGNGNMRVNLPKGIDISIYRDSVTVPANGSKMVYMFRKLNNYYKNAANVKTFVSAHPNTPDMRQITATTNIMYDSDDDPEIAIEVFNNSNVDTDVALDVLVIGETKT